MNVLQNLDSLDSFDPLVALKKQRKIEWVNKISDIALNWVEISWFRINQETSAYLLI